MKDPDDVFKADLTKSLFTWAILEGLCFWLMPFVKAIEYSRIEAWLIPTVVAGIVGSFVVAFTGRALVETEYVVDAATKDRNRRVLSIVSLVGLGMLSIPLFLGGVEFSHSIGNYDWKNWGKTETPSP